MWETTVESLKAYERNRILEPKNTRKTVKKAKVVKVPSDDPIIFAKSSGAPLPFPEVDYDSADDQRFFEQFDEFGFLKDGYLR